MTLTEEQYNQEIMEKYKNIPCDFCGETPKNYALHQHAIKQADGDYKIYELKVCEECGKIPEVQLKIREYMPKMKRLESSVSREEIENFMKDVCKKGE